MGSFFGSAGSEVAMSALSGVAGVMNQMSVNDTNRAINSSSQRFQAEENRLSRDFAAQQQELAQQYNTQERIAAQNYNSLPNQVKLARKAGLNPAVYFGSGKTGSVSSPASVSPASPSMTGAPSMIPMQAYSGFPQLMSGAAEMIQALSGAKKSGVEASSLEAQLPYLIEQLRLTNEHQQYENMLTKTKAQFEAAHVPERAQELFATIQLLRAQEYSALKQGKSFEASADLARADAALKKELKNVNYWQALILQNEYEAWDTMNNLKIKNIQSDTSRNLASAEESRTAAKVNLSVEALNGIRKQADELQLSQDRSTYQSKLRALINGYVKEATLSEKETRDLFKKLDAIERVESSKFTDAVDRMVLYFKDRGIHIPTPSFMLMK